MCMCNINHFLVQAIPAVSDVPPPPEYCQDVQQSLCLLDLRPHHCYSAYNRALCCRTCYVIKTNNANDGRDESVTSVRKW